jgi:predicted RNA-binding Zn-ribbon protein involved in translation (DUF1610 family)
VLPDSTPASDSAGRLAFNCSSCGLKLTVERRLAGVSGPCPACGAPIHAPALPSKAASSRQRGRIAGDSIVDHQHLERRETAKTLWIIMLFILAFCACLAVSWFMKDWIRR